MRVRVGPDGRHGDGGGDGEQFVSSEDVIFPSVCNIYFASHLSIVVNGNGITHVSQVIAGYRSVDFVPPTLFEKMPGSTFLAFFVNSH